MIQKAAQYVAQYWARKEVIGIDDEEVFQYGLELALSSVLNLLCIVLISEYFKLPFTWLFFLLAFIPLRTSAGGYHAKTHWGCILSFSVVFSLTLLLVSTIPAIVCPAVNIGMSLCSGLIVFILSPVEDANKPLSEREQKRGRVKSLILIAVFTIPSLLSFALTALQVPMLTIFYLGELSAALSLAIAKILRRTSITPPHE